MKKQKLLEKLQANLSQVQYPQDGNTWFEQLERGLQEVLIENLTDSGGEFILEYSTIQKKFFLRWRKQLCLPEQLRRLRNYGCLEMEYSIDPAEDLLSQVINIRQDVNFVTEWHNTNEHQMYSVLRERDGR